MKQKRTFIAVLLVIAVLALGVAYALSNVTLTVTGSATASASDKNFKIGVTAMAEETASVVNVDATDSLTPSITVTTSEFGEQGVQTVNFTAQNFSTAGDKVVAKVTVKNSSTTLAASLAAVSVADTDNFKVEKTGYVKGTSAAANTIVLEPGETATFTVSMELKATPLADLDAETVTATFVATPQAPQAN